MTTAPKTKAANTAGDKDGCSTVSPPAPPTSDNFLLELSALRRSIIQSSSSLSPTKQQHRSRPKKRRSTGSYDTPSLSSPTRPNDNMESLKVELQKCQNLLALEKESNKSKTSSLHSKISNLQNQLQQSQTNHTQITSAQQQKIQTLQTALSQKEEENKALQSKLLSLEQSHLVENKDNTSTITNLTSKIQTLTGANEKILQSKDALEAQLFSTKRHLKECQDSIASIEKTKDGEIQLLKECCEGLERSLKKSTDRNELMRGETERLKNRLEVVETKHQQNQSTIDSFQTQIDELSKAHQMAISNAQSLTTNKVDLQTEISSLEGSVTKKEGLIAQLRKELKESQEKVGQVKKDYENKILQLKEQQKVTAVDTSQIKELQTNLADSQTQMEKMKETITTLEGRLSEKMELLEKRQKITIAMKKKIAMLTEKLESASKNTGATGGGTNEDAKANNKVVEELQTKLAQTQSQLEKTKQDLATSENRLAEKMEILKAREKLHIGMKKKVAVLTERLKSAPPKDITGAGSTAKEEEVVEEAIITQEKIQLQQTNALLENLKSQLEEAQKQHSHTLTTTQQEKQQLQSDFEKKIMEKKQEMEEEFKTKIQREVEVTSQSWKEEMVEKEDELQCAVEEVKRCRAIISEKETAVAVIEGTMSKKNELLAKLREELEEANSDAMVLTKKLEAVTKENDELRTKVQTLKDLEAQHTADAALRRLQSELDTATDELEKVKRARDAAITRAEYAEQAFMDMTSAKEQEEAMTFATGETVKRKMASSKKKEEMAVGVSNVEHPAAKKQKSDKEVMMTTATMGTEDAVKEAIITASLNEDSAVETETEDEE